MIRSVPLRRTRGPGRPPAFLAAGSHGILVLPAGRATLSPGRFRDDDFLSLHERLLGREAEPLLARAQATGGLDIDTANASFFRKLQAGACRVAVTATGAIGDSGMGTSVYFTALDGPTRERLHRSEAGYRSSLEQHQVMRSVCRATLAEGAFCMGLNLGLDNRGLLPPFMPVGRRARMPCAAILRSCFPTPARGSSRGCSSTSPPSPRRRGGTLGEQVVRLSTGQVIQALAGSFPLRPDQAEGGKNLRALGQWLLELGDTAAADFAEAVRASGSGPRGAPRLATGWAAAKAWRCAGVLGRRRPADIGKHEGRLARPALPPTQRPGRKRWGGRDADGVAALGPAVRPASGDMARHG